MIWLDRQLVRTHLALDAHCPALNKRDKKRHPFSQSVGNG